MPSATIKIFSLYYTQYRTRTRCNCSLTIRAISNYLKYRSQNSKLNATSTYSVARNRDAVKAIRIHLPVTINIQLIQKFLKRILFSRAY